MLLLRSGKKVKIQIEKARAYKLASAAARQAASPPNHSPRLDMFELHFSACSVQQPRTKRTAQEINNRGGSAS